MKLHRTALAALIGTTISGFALAPSAIAQQSIQPPGVTDPGARQPMERGMHRGSEHRRDFDRTHRDGPAIRRGHHRGPGMEMRNGGLFNSAHSPQALEMVLIRIAYTADLDEDQQDLLSTLRSDLLAAHSAFVDATEDLRPDRDGFTRRASPTMDMSARLANIIALQQARLDALEAIQPAFDAFLDSLTDEQLDRIHPRGWQNPETADPVEPTEPPATTDAPPRAPSEPLSSPADPEEPAQPSSGNDEPLDEEPEDAAPVG